MIYRICDEIMCLGEYRLQTTRWYPWRGRWVYGAVRGLLAIEATTGPPLVGATDCSSAVYSLETGRTPRRASWASSTRHCFPKSSNNSLFIREANVLASIAFILWFISWSVDIRKFYKLSLTVLLIWICLSAGGLRKIRQPYNFQKNLLRHYSGNWYVHCVTQELKMLRKQVRVTCICMR
jgi:hypothetical protein